MTTLPKATYRFSAFPIKIPTVFVTELEEIIFKFVHRHKNIQNNVEKEKQSWKYQLPDFRLYYKVK